MFNIIHMLFCPACKTVQLVLIKRVSDSVLVHGVDMPLIIIQMLSCIIRISTVWYQCTDKFLVWCTSSMQLPVCSCYS